eukprot:gene20373-26441_t
MTSLEPLFIDITWGAGGSTKELSMTLCEYSQKYFGVTVLMHLTCTNLKINEIKSILQSAKDAGIKNILALRGELNKGSFVWEPIPDGLSNAIDLVKLIRQLYGDYFCIAVAGFPEGHPYSKDPSTDIQYLKEKIDAGADFILTQFFYDTDIYIDYINKCRSYGITCPIIPGFMPIQSYSSFQKMTTFCKTKVPSYIWNDINPIKSDDEAIKAYEKSVLSILKSLGVDETKAVRRALPWRASRSNNNGVIEAVRPINWANRTKSYIQRTETWDEYPNGRWGDGRSPAFGELSNYQFFKPLVSKEERLAMWGESPLTLEDVYEVFAKYVEGKIPILPWSESPLQAETIEISSYLANINRRGYLTINSQPAVNGEKSTHPVYGWGGIGGRVYQKAYVEFFISPTLLDILLQVVNSKSNLSLHAVNSSKDIIIANGRKGVSALTWGVFQNSEILQPTVFDHDVFLIWSEEAFQLWLSYWATIYDDETDSSGLIYDIHDTFYLVAIIDNDFIESNLFSVFDEAIEIQNKTKSKDK